MNGGEGEAEEGGWNKEGDGETRRRMRGLKRGGSHRTRNKGERRER